MLSFQFLVQGQRDSQGRGLLNGHVVMAERIEIRKGHYDDT